MRAPGRHTGVFLAGRVPFVSWFQRETDRKYVSFSSSYSFMFLFFWGGALKQTPTRMSGRVVPDLSRPLDEQLHAGELQASWLPEAG